MPRHSEARDLKFPCEQMFAVVADVERYPEFLPWCSELKIKSRAKDGDAEVLIAEMAVNYHGMRERYTSRVRLEPKLYTVTAQHIEGPFHHLDTVWRFEPLGRFCRVHFTIDFAFKNWVLSALSGIAFEAAAHRMTNAFVRRAKELYGTSKQAAQ